MGIAIGIYTKYIIYLNGPSVYGQGGTWYIGYVLPNNRATTTAVVLAVIVLLITGR